MIDILNSLVPFQSVLVAITTSLMGVILYKLQHMDQQRDKARDEAKKSNKEKDYRLELTIAGVKSLLRGELRCLHDIYTKNGYITSSQRDDWDEIFETYTALNGNGLGLTYDREIKALPIQDDISKKGRNK